MLLVGLTQRWAQLKRYRRWKSLHHVHDLSDLTSRVPR